MTNNSSNRTNAFYSEEELSSLPEYPIYKQKLYELLELDLSQYSTIELGHQIMDRLVLFPGLTLRMYPEQINKMIFYRARLNIDLNREDLSNPKTYGYPKPEICKQNNRANIEGTTVFYCSPNPWGAILECKPSENDIIYLGIWEASAVSNIKASLCLPENIDQNNAAKLMAKQIHRLSLQHSNAHGRDKSKQLKLLHQFIPEILNKDKPPYLISSWISYQIMKENGYDLMLYPSVIRSDFLNLAINPNVIDDNLRLKQVIKFKATRGGDVKPLKISNGYIGDVINNIVNYRKWTNNDIEFINSILS